MTIFILSNYMVGFFFKKRQYSIYLSQWKSVRYGNHNRIIITYFSVF